jgi:demethylmenaquinone methyltransferase / 2-methoxy-6-polyprenyl-1,4-benzoquinol methylase
MLVSLVQHSITKHGLMNLPSPSPSPLPPHRPLSEFYGAAEKRHEFVNGLFDAAARDYDWVSAAMSFGSDRWYRRQALQRAGLQVGMTMLDVATGTGLMVRAALELGLSPAQITGVDPSPGMLAENRRRHPVRLIEGRGERLPLSDAAFDFVCMGYALRHVEDLHALFAELKRVLRPGGLLLILEITRPANPVVLKATQIYMQHLVPALGWLRRGNQSTARLLGYYWATIAECAPPSVILSALTAQGFQDVRRATTGPVLSEYIARR